MVVLKLQARKGLTVREIIGLQKTLQAQLGWHAARTKFAAAFLLAILKVKTVNFPRLALALNPRAKSASNERRLQRFFALFKLDLDAFARLLVRLLPVTDRLSVTLDRTHWQLGKIDINILLFGVAYQGVSLPIVWKLLGKRGNSQQQEREELLTRLLKVIPAERIKLLLADREFISHDWFALLLDKGVPFVIRIRKNARVTSRGRTKSAGEWIRSLPPGATLTRQKRVKVYGCKLYLTSLRRADTEGDVLVVSDHRHPDALSAYAQRWSIELLFHSLKSRGFELESTHLKHDERLEKLLALLALAFTFAFLVGDWQAQQQPIRIKRHGRKERSLFRLGLDHLSRILFGQPHHQHEFNQCLKVLTT